MTIICDWCQTEILEGERTTPVFIPPIDFPTGEVPIPTGAQQLHFHTDGCLEPWTTKAKKDKGERIVT